LKNSLLPIKIKQTGGSHTRIKTGPGQRNQRQVMVGGHTDDDTAMLDTFPVMMIFSN
jgi:hypothetical protein